MSDAATETRDLAAVIADVLFERDGAVPLPPPERLRHLDGAFADALTSLETHVEAFGDDLATSVLVLLRDVRNGVAERTAVRITAEVLLRHVAAAVGVATIEPLIRFLGALAVLPDGPGTYERALDPTPDPDSAIEVAMARMVDDPGARGELRRTLFEGAVIVPVLDLDVEGSELSLQFLPVVVRGQPMISVFTSRARLAEHTSAAGIDEIPAIEIGGSELAAICPPGHGVAIDPGWVLGCVFEEVEVRALPDAPAFVLPGGDGELSGAVHPAVIGAIDAVRPGLAAFGVEDLVVASRDEHVVIAVVVAAGTTPEQAVRRVGVALAERGLHGPVLVPSTSPLGQTVLATTGR